MPIGLPPNANRSLVHVRSAPVHDPRSSISTPAGRQPDNCTMKDTTLARMEGELKELECSIYTRRTHVQTTTRPRRHFGRPLDHLETEDAPKYTCDLKRPGLVGV